MSQPASVALQSARIWLNDENALAWTDFILMSKLQEAHRELIIKLRANSLPVIKNQSARFTVTANTTNLYTASLQPTNIIAPITLLENIVGGAVDTFREMEQVTFLPTILPRQELTYWAWLQEQIILVPSTAPRDLIIRFKGSITTPSTQNDPIGFIMGESYLGPRVAALCLQTIGKNGDIQNKAADAAIWDIVRSNVTEDQRPTRRRGYRSSRRRYLDENWSTPVVVGSGGGGGPVQKQEQIFTATGGQTSFTPAFSPLASCEVYVNGLLQAPGIAPYFYIGVSGPSIIFAAGLSAGDIVDLIQYNS